MASTPYTSWIGHGAVCPTPPVSFSNVRGHVFGVNACRRAIQCLVDELLTPAAQGVVKYWCPAGGALITFNDAERCASTMDRIGWMPGREVAIWVLLIEERKEPPFGIRPVLWAPYIFIDTDLGMVPGREIWGWPKAFGHVAMATDTPGLPAHFGVRATIFRTFDPDLQGEVVELIGVTGTKPLELGDPTWRNGADVVSALADELLGDFAGELLRMLSIEPVLPAMALKQFRDVIDPTAVCFRALVNAPCRFTQFRGGHLLADTFTLTIETCASHAIAKDLGIETQSRSTLIPVRWAAALDFDFLAENGSAIVPHA
jgi:hypothetical protein